MPLTQSQSRNPDRPRLADGVAVHPPAGDGAPWVIQRGQQQYFRVEPDLARLVQLLDGSRNHADLVAELGDPWTERSLDTAIDTLDNGGLLAGGKPIRTSSPWVKLVPPLTLQVTLVRPHGPLRRLGALARAAVSRGGRIAVAAFLVLGFVALLTQAGAAVSALSRPLPLTVYAGVGIAVIVSTVLHELGHGAVLSHHGGTPSRLGVMLFYLSPAFFCDVSDGWRLPHNQQRVQVALAGVVTQGLLSATASVAAWFASDGVRDGLLIFALVTFVAGALNLLPFVKLDGYIALMSHLDVPHLRDRSMEDAQGWVARGLFGGRYDRQLPQFSWAPWYGLVCALFPLYLVVMALRLWGTVFQQLGLVGAVTVALLVTFVAAMLIRGLVGLLRRARAAGAGVVRIVLVTASIAAVVGIALGMVRVPYHVEGGYVRDADGLSLAVRTDADVETLGRLADPSDATVTLLRPGLVRHEHVGEAHLTSTEATTRWVDIGAFVPIESNGLEIQAQALPLQTQPGVDTGQAGTARVDAGDLPLAEWIYRRYVSPVIG